MGKDPELERFKALDLVGFAEAHGYTVTGRRQNGRLAELRHTDGDRIDITEDDDGHHVFKSWNHDARGSIVDFVQHIHHGATLGRVRQILRPWVQSGTLFPSARPPSPKPAPVPLDRAAMAAKWRGHAPYRGNYLQGRGLDAATLAAVADRIRTDERGNVAFRHDDRDGLTGWELKNRRFTGFAEGGRKSLFALRTGQPPKEDPPRVVVAESALDALSFWQMHPAPALLLSFGGGMSHEQEDLLRHVLAKYPSAEVLTATDADEQGDIYAAKIAAMRPDAIRAKPTTGKDWNDALRATPPTQPPNPSRNALACLL